MPETRETRAVLPSPILPSGTARSAARPYFPAWILRLAVPAWVTGPDRRLRAMNEPARRVLGLADGVDVVGRRCHEIVGSKREAGYVATAYDGREHLVPFCSARCPFFDRIEKGEDLEPLELCVITREAGEHWIQLLPILVRTEEEQLLVHCALPADREHRITQYMAHVAGRSHHRVFSTAMQSLSPRELETLELLARDLTPNDIADRLHVSYVTVRNHIQHIQAKLDVHSTLEAVALYLLESGTDPAGE